MKNKTLFPRVNHGPRNHCPGLLLLTLMFLALLLSACGSRPQTADTRVPPTPTLTTTAMPSPSQTPTATVTVKPSPTSSPTPEETFAATPASIHTPSGGPESYRLKKWDQAAAMQAIQAAENAQISEDYQDLGGFYQLSLLYELFLDHPELQADAELLQKTALLKGLAVPVSSYGWIHDSAVEPFRKLFEDTLNAGGLDPSDAGQLDAWLDTLGAGVADTDNVSSRMIDRPGTTTVLKIFKNGGWGFFIVHQEENGRYTVMALHPEWRREWWSDENFQITDLNANGRDEIALIYDFWSTGFSHCCESHFNLYEWNGSAFEDLMADPLEILILTRYGSCIDYQFVPDTAGGYQIHTGTTQYTLCEELPYVDPVEFYWNGQGFVQKPQSIPTVSLHNKPSRCTIDWALTAGPENDTAVQLLTSALTDWPAEAEKEWGPAAQDYFRLKLATWNIRRGQVELGLSQLAQVREHPASPDYPLPAKVAGTFLDTYQTQGFYQAVAAVGTLYYKELENIQACSITLSCDVAKMRQSWGFAENEWSTEVDGRFQNDFERIDALPLDIRQRNFTDLPSLQASLEEIHIKPVWSAEGNLDDRGEKDWLLILETQFSRGDIVVRHYWLYGFLRNNGQMTLLPFDTYLPEDTPTSTVRWESFRPAPNAPLLQVLQSGDWLQVINVFQKEGSYQYEVKFDTLDITRGISTGRIEDWKIEPGKLVIQYQENQGEYRWDAQANNLVPTGYSPELQDEHIKEAERAIYLDQHPEVAIEILSNLLKERVSENCDWNSYQSVSDPPRVKPYLLYLLGLAYERSGDEDHAVATYWQLWHDYPAFPFNLAVQEKLVPR